MTSKLAAMQARFQQKQMQEKEEKLLRLYETQQQRAFDRVGRGSAGSNTSIGSNTSFGSTGGGKVRQMFDERRQKAGIDRSYPLEPLGNKTNISTKSNNVDALKNNKNTTSRTVARSTIQKSVSQVRNGKPLVNKRQTVQRAYNNNNGVETYEENRYDDNFNDSHSRNDSHDLISMMNRHNLCDNLEDEELPQLDFDEIDDTYLTGKLPNVGGKLPSQNGSRNIPARAGSDAVKSNVSTTVRNDKSVVKKTPLKIISSSPKKTIASPNPQAIKPSSPQRLVANKMSKSQTSTRVPSTARPSARQTGRTTSAVARDDLEECQFCGRRFTADRIETHQNVCGRTAKKQRKTYDAFKHRVQGTELEPFVRKPSKNGSKISSLKKQSSAASGAGNNKSSWRRTHEEFIATIRAAKIAQAHLARGGKLSDLPPPPPSTNPDYVQCPHCGRRFNESAAERHIPKCASYDYNKPKPTQSKLKR